MNNFSKSLDNIGTPRAKVGMSSGKVHPKNEHKDPTLKNSTLQRKYLEMQQQQHQQQFLHDALHQPMHPSFPFQGYIHKSHFVNVLSTDLMS